MGERSRVYVTRRVPQAGLDRLEGQCELSVWNGATPPPREVFVERLREFEPDGLFCNVADTVDATVMDASPSLRTIGTMSVGYDHIDLGAAIDRGITVGHTPGVLSETTADFAWSLLMAAVRRIIEADERVKAGDWDAWGPKVLLGRDVHEATIGIVGLGDIGTAFARRTAGFNMDVLYAETHRREAAEAELSGYGIDAEYCEFDELLERVDFLSVHVPLRAETEGLIGENELRRLDDDAILVNTARGEVVDTDALDHALEAGWIRHAALDVTDPEPLPPDHPILHHSPQKLTVTPHIGSATVETRTEMAVMTADSILAGLRGDRPTHSALADADYL